MATKQKTQAKGTGIRAWLKDSVIRGLIISLALCIISMVGAGLLQTDFGNISVKDVRTVGPNGKVLSGLLYKPDTATAENPAPAVVVVHGWWKSREAPQSVALELARRGYVAFAIDMSGHGHTEIWDENVDTADDSYAALKMLEEVNLVDPARIAATGHSSGGSSINAAFDLAKEKGGINFAALLFTGDDPTYENEDGEYYDKYGAIDVGVIASRYDDWYFNNADENGEWQNAPRDYLKNSDAQSFVGFGDPEAAGGEVVPAQFYSKEIDGVQARRIIYQPTQIHSWNVLSPTVTGYTIDFFESALPAPNPIPSSNQHGFLKECFTGLGAVGFILFAVYFSLAMLKTPSFRSLAADSPAQPAPAPTGAGRWWFWGGLIASALFSFFTVAPISRFFYTKLSPVFPCEIAAALGVWGAVGSLFTLAILLAYYYTYAKKRGFSLWETGALIHKKTLGKTILLSLIVVTVAYGLVFFADYFFKTDFRFWTISIKAFTSERVLYMIVYCIPFFAYYVMNSVSVNCFRFNKLGGHEWINMAVLAFFNALGAILYEVIQYTTFLSTGYSRWHIVEVEQALPGWLYGIIIILIVAPIVSRKIYKATKNPYLAGIINGLIVTAISVSNAVVNL